VRPGDDRFPYGGPRLALDQGRRPLLFLVIFSFTLMNLPIPCMTERHRRQGASGRALTRLPSPKLNGDGHSQPHAVRPELLWRALLSQSGRKPLSALASNPAGWAGVAPFVRFLPRACGPVLASNPAG